MSNPEIKTLWRVSYTSITEVVVVDESTTTVIYKNKFGRITRERKKASNRSWHESKKDAVEQVVNNLKQEINRLQKQIEHLAEDIVRVKSL